MGRSMEPFDATLLAQLRELDDDGTFIQEIFAMFREDIATNLGRLDEAIEMGDATTIRSVAHQAKGASRNLGLCALGESLAAMEQGSEQSAPELLAAIATVRADVRAALQYLDAAESGAAA